MLEDLTIKNFALIDSAFIEFEKGFTVLSGETGAGKSILIGALSFLLGGKASMEQIRGGASEASVSGTFYLPNLSEKANTEISENEEPLSAGQWLFQHGIEAEDGRIILRRVIRDNGKTSAWIGSASVTRSDLASFSQFLVDIHGQHEHQSLMRVPEHRKFLDAYAGVTDEVAAFTKLYSALVEKRKILDGMNTSDAEKNRRIEYLSFAIEEIENAQLKENEDEELSAEETKLSSFEKLYSEVDALNSILSGDEASSILPLVKKVRSHSQRAVTMDKNLESLDGRIENLFYEISDLSEEFHSYGSSLVFDSGRLEEVQNRLQVIYKLKKKYASGTDAPLSEVISYMNDAKKELEVLSTSEENKAALIAEISGLEKKVYTGAKSISIKRKASGDKMAVEVENILSNLGMKGTKFAVSLTEKAGNNVEQKCGPYGMDDIEFLISANPGSPLLPLAKIASGGELSRVMLALKTIFAGSDTVGTLIFDEIDTGIGGEVAVAVGNHMKNLAAGRQILCITHLASIAVYADNQIKIQKNIADGVMRTGAAAVKGEERVAEIARMLSGDPLSGESLEHARSMLKKFSGA